MHIKGKRFCKILFLHTSVVSHHKKLKCLDVKKITLVLNESFEIKLLTWNEISDCHDELWLGNSFHNCFTMFHISNSNSISLTLRYIHNYEFENITSMVITKTNLFDIEIEANVQS